MPDGDTSEGLISVVLITFLFTSTEVLHRGTDSRGLSNIRRGLDNDTFPGGGRTRFSPALPSSRRFGLFCVGKNARSAEPKIRES